MSSVLTAPAPVKARSRKPRPKPQRFIKLLLPLAAEGSGSGVLEITMKGPGPKVQATDYFVTRLGSDWGDAFRLEKIGGEPGEHYDVHLSDEGHSCECKGFLAHNHCKHVAGLVALRSRNLI